jgi:hypothetical protein
VFISPALSKDRKKRSKLHVSLLIFPQAFDSLCRPFFFLPSFFPCSPVPRHPPSHLWPSLLYPHLTIRTTIPKTPPRPTSTPPSRRPPQLFLSPKLQPPTVDIPPRPPPLAPRRTNTEIPLTSKGRPSPALGGAVAGAYLFCKHVLQTRPSVRSHPLLCTSIRTCRLRRKVRPPLARRCALHMVDANSPARFPASRTLPRYPEMRRTARRR